MDDQVDTSNKHIALGVFAWVCAILPWINAYYDLLPISFGIADIFLIPFLTLIFGIFGAMLIGSGISSKIIAKKQSLAIKKINFTHIVLIMAALGVVAYLMMREKPYGTEIFLIVYVTVVVTVSITYFLKSKLYK